jgi:class 3 adenylate cyclase
MPRLQFRRFSDASDVRELPLMVARVVTLGETNVGVSRWEPGWRWSTHLKPVLQSDWCPYHHLGYAVSGWLHVVTPDGESLDIPPDSAYEIPPGHDAWVVGDEAFVTVEWTSAADVARAPEEASRSLATIVFTDVVDSTAALERMGDAAWQRLLAQHNLRLRADLNRFRGREVATTGDGFLATFDSATLAVRCALAMVGSADQLGLRIRAGVHTGEVEHIGGDVRGVAVHAAARILAAAGPGEVLLSATTRDLLEGSGMELEHAGSRELKGLSGMRDVYRVTGVPSAL